MCDAREDLRVRANPAGRMWVLATAVAISVVWALGCNRSDGAVASDAPARLESVSMEAAVSQADATPQAEHPEEREPSEVTLANAPGLQAGQDQADGDDGQPEPEPEPERPTFSADDPATVLILGDSLAATGFGALLERRLDAHPAIVAHRRGKSASGLARPDFFDWFAEGKRQVELREPDLVVVIMGGNDGQDLTRRVRGERRVPWKHEDWEGAYRERMDLLLDVLAAKERQVLWLGLPTMGLRSLERKLELIRRIQQEAVEARGEGFVYLDTAPFVSDDAGEMLTHAPVGARQRREKIRAEDEIHFTMSGSEYLADKVYPQVLGTLLLDDIEPQGNAG